MNIVDENSSIYLQLREVIREKIETGEYGPGCPIPSESTLAKTYGINRLTVRNALSILEKEGLLKAVQGKGVFVVGKKFEQDLDNYTGFHKAIEGHKAQPAIKILEKGLRKAGSVYAKYLEIDPNDDIFFIKRLDSVNGEPFSMEYIYIPSVFVPNLQSIDLSIFPLTDIYSFYDTMPVRAWQTLDVVNLEANVARTLHVDSDSHALLFTCWSYRKDGRVVEFMRSFNRCDLCSFKVKNCIR